MGPYMDGAGAIYGGTSSISSSMVAGEAAPRGPTLLRARLSHKLAQTNRWAHADTIWWLCIRFTLFNFISIKCVLMSHVSAPRLGIDPTPDFATVYVAQNNIS